MSEMLYNESYLQIEIRSLLLFPTWVGKTETFCKTRFMVLKHFFYNFVQYISMYSIIKHIKPIIIKIIVLYCKHFIPYGKDFS